MHRDSINRRLAALESQYPEPMPKVTIILQWPDGHCTHDVTHYVSLQEAMDILHPEDVILVDVRDMSKPAATAKE